MITNDIVIFGLLGSVLALAFYTKSLGGFWDKFYTFIPIILVCYLLPSVMVVSGLVDMSNSQLWPIARDAFLPAALILMCLSVDLGGIARLGPKAITMFLTATAGIIIGGPIALLIVAYFNPEIVGSGYDAAWRGLATVAGSWIGGGANQTAMLEVFQYNPERYSVMIAVDIVVANILMAFLLYGVGKREKIDAWLKADNSAIDRLQAQMTSYSESVSRVPSANDLMILIGGTFAMVGLSHLLGGWIGAAFGSWLGEESTLASSFLWVVVLATTFGVAASFTRIRQYEGIGASKIGTVFIFLLVLVIGTKMDILQLAEAPAFMAVGLIWMLVHVLLLFAVAKIIRAPFFFIAVGSQANVGGAASAPVVASAFHPSLAPVGVLLAVLGYALGTYGAILCAEMMRMVG